MSSGNFSERAKARKWAREHPLRGIVRRALFEIFCEIIDEERVFHAGVRWLAWRIGGTTPPVVRQLREFRQRGLIEFVDRKKHGSKRYRLNYDRSADLYPDTVTRDQFMAACNEVTRYDEDDDPAAYNEVTRYEPQETDPQRVTSVPAACNERTGQRVTSAPQRVTSEAPACNFDASSVQRGYTKGFEVNHQEEKQGEKQREIQGAQSARACPLARTHSLPTTGDGSEVNRPGGNEIAARALAMVDAFFAQCESNHQRRKVEDECLNLAKLGASVEDMRATVRTMGGRVARWGAVACELHRMVRDRQSVVDHRHQFSEEILHAARHLEAIFERYVDKPAWTANRNRWDMGNWLCLCVRNDNVDEATFETVCRDVKKAANGKTPTWKGVRSALDARTRARSSDRQQSEKAKRFFDQPAIAAGTFILSGNDTRH